MTKIGEGKEGPHEATVQQYHKEVESHASKFLNALESYDRASDKEEKVRLKAVMDDSLALMNAAVKEIKQAGIYKQGGKVEKDYQAYIEKPSQENLQVLEEDLSTLRDYNKL